MTKKITGEQPFQVLSTNFSLGPSSTPGGYVLQVSADGTAYSDLFSVNQGVTRMVTNVANGSYFRMKNNTDTVTLNWERQCSDGGSGGGSSDYAASAGTSNSTRLLEGQGNFPQDAEEGDVVAIRETPPTRGRRDASIEAGIYQYSNGEWSKAEGLEGPQGPQGPAGPQGPQGPAGQDGINQDPTILKSVSALPQSAETGDIVALSQEGNPGAAVVRRIDGDNGPYWEVFDMNNDAGVDQVIFGDFYNEGWHGYFGIFWGYDEDYEVYRWYVTEGESYNLSNNGDTYSIYDIQGYDSSEKLNISTTYNAFEMFSVDEGNGVYTLRVEGNMAEESDITLADITPSRLGMYQYDGTSWNEFEGVQGPQGAQGATGAQGPVGPQGPEGPQGPQGPAGQDGQDGQDGAQGPQGPVGPQGPEGPQGPQGPAGGSVSGDTEILKGVRSLPQSPDAGDVVSFVSGTSVDFGEWYAAGAEYPNRYLFDFTPTSEMEGASPCTIASFIADDNGNEATFNLDLYYESGDWIASVYALDGISNDPVDLTQLVQEGNQSDWYYGWHITVNDNPYVDYVDIAVEATEDNGVYTYHFYIEANKNGASDASEYDFNLNNGVHTVDGVSIKQYNGTSWNEIIALDANRLVPIGGSSQDVLGADGGTPVWRTQGTVVTDVLKTGFNYEPTSGNTQALIRSSYNDFEYKPVITGDGITGIVKITSGAYQTLISQSATVPTVLYVVVPDPAPVPSLQTINVTNMSPNTYGSKSVAFLGGNLAAEITNNGSTDSLASGNTTGEAYNISYNNGVVTFEGAFSGTMAYLMYEVDGVDQGPCDNCEASGTVTISGDTTQLAFSVSCTTDSECDCYENSGCWDSENQTCYYSGDPGYDACDCVANGGSWDGNECQYDVEPDYCDEYGPDYDQDACACETAGGHWEDDGEGNYSCECYGDPECECAVAGGSWDGMMYTCDCGGDPGCECRQLGGEWVEVGTDQYACMCGENEECDCVTNGGTWYYNENSGDYECDYVCGGDSTCLNCETNGGTWVDDGEGNFSCDCGGDPGCECVTGGGEWDDTLNDGQGGCVMPE